MYKLKRQEWWLAVKILEKLFFIFFAFCPVCEEDVRCNSK